MLAYHHTFSLRLTASVNPYLSTTSVDITARVGWVGAALVAAWASRAPTRDAPTPFASPAPVVPAEAGISQLSPCHSEPFGRLRTGSAEESLGRRPGVHQRSPERCFDSASGYAQHDKREASVIPAPFRHSREGGNPEAVRRVRAPSFPRFRARGGRNLAAPFPDRQGWTRMHRMAGIRPAERLYGRPVAAVVFLEPPL